MQRMCHALRPLFVTVTWGAGGSTSAKSLELAEICQRQLGLTTCLHLTCTNMSKRLIDEALVEAKALGIRNILALRGDPPREDEYGIEHGEEDANQSFVWAADLVTYIKKSYGDYFCIGVAGYPESHSDESHPVDQNPKHDMPYLVEKVQAGADFIMTQLFYDVEAYKRYEDLVRSWDDNVLGTIPIIPGLMPIQNYQVLKRTTKLSHASLPPALLERLEKSKGDDEEVKKIGIGIVSEIVQEVKRFPNPTPFPRGFHFFTLNLEKTVGFILETCDLIPSITPTMYTPESSNPTTPFTESHAFKHMHTIPTDHADDLSSTHQHKHNLESPPSPLTPPVDRSTDLSTSHGLGSQGREATWDDYPNGRFGDSRSPAFGEIDGYSYSSLHLSPAAARTKWGTPTTPKDICTLFARHVKGDLDILPWSEGGLSEETITIRDDLLNLIEGKGWWTIASQPAVNGISSSNRIHGWGPINGFVFQKPFVEFFLPITQWKQNLRPQLLSTDCRDEVSWYAVTQDSSNYESNADYRDLPAPAQTSTSLATTTAGYLDASKGQNASVGAKKPEPEVNAVTWGAFPGKEIVTPTIIEEVSFRSWGEEAFGIWREWERCFALRGQTREFLRNMRESIILVNVIGHDFQSPEALWNILMGA